MRSEMMKLGCSSRSCARRRPARRLLRLLAELARRHHGGRRGDHGQSLRSGWLDHWWAAEGFKDNSSLLGHGFGSDNKCDSHKALGRTMNALFLLSSPFTGEQLGAI